MIRIIIIIAVVVVRPVGLRSAYNNNNNNNVKRRGNFRVMTENASCGLLPRGRPREARRQTRVCAPVAVSLLIIDGGGPEHAIRRSCCTGSHLTTCMWYYNRFDREARWPDQSPTRHPKQHRNTPCTPCIGGKLAGRVVKDTPKERLRRPPWSDDGTSPSQRRRDASPPSRGQVDEHESLPGAASPRRATGDRRKRRPASSAYPTSPGVAGTRYHVLVETGGSSYGV